LCWIYDSNRITIEGGTPLAFGDDVGARFLAYGWNVVHVTDANDLNLIRAGFRAFLQTNDRPTLIIVNSHIGYGSPHKQDTFEAHGEPLGEAEVRLVKKFYGWPEDAKFMVPEGVYERFQEGIGKRGSQLRSQWEKTFADYAVRYPDLAQRIEQMQHRALPGGWDKNLPTFPADAKGMATRESSGKALNALAQNIPWLVGGSADLAKSNKVNLTFEGAGDFQAGTYGGRNLHFGVREHAMGAAVTGMVLSNLRAFGATFFNFTDYMRPSMRLAALMEIPALYVMTHDSIGVGEDGPTHQPIEQIASLRAMPNMLVLRPGDANEVIEVYKIAIQQTHRPATLVLTRQPLPTLDRTKYAPASGTQKGAYILADAPGGKPDVILMGTGSELSLCVDAYEKLKAEGVNARVVSMPSWEIFDEQDEAYKESVLPLEVTARVSVEMAATFGWDRYVGPKGRSIGMHRFGASAPLKDLLKKFGFTVDAVVAEARKAIAGAK
jgi:transketolase